MLVKTLIDTSALLAFLDPKDTWHDRCKRALSEAPLPLGTTTGVLTELFYFVLQRRVSLDAAWRAVREWPIFVGLVGNDDLPALETLMLRYADRPMDFADATLVHVAAREGVSTILTIDHDDFETYRIGRSRKFRILPER